MKPLILVTNDDGVYSPGLRILYEAVRDLGKVVIVVPETPKSATGLGLTLHKPLRIMKMKVFGFEAYLVSGTPSDIIHIALSELLERKPDIVLSGINLGDNTSIQVILSSGTVGAAIQAVLLGIPAIAFSVAVSEPDELVENSKLKSIMVKISKFITKYVLEKGIPQGVELLNVNFPSKVKDDIRVKVVPAAKLRFKERVLKRVDPQGKPYYWVYGEPLSAEPNTDVYVVLEEGNIAITPLKLDLNTILSNEEFKYFEPLVNELNKMLTG